MPEAILQESWAVDISVRVNTLRAVAARAATTPAATAAARLLDLADSAARGRRKLRGPIARWRGTQVALAYQCVHEAEVQLVELKSPEEVDASVPAVVARARKVLDPTDPRRIAIDQLPQLAARQPHPPGLPSALQEAMRIGFEATDQLHVRVRSFRNLIIGAAVVITLFMAIVVALVAWHPAAMPTCFKPGAEWECPSGAHHPTGGDLPIVAGLGLLGGALAAAFSIRRVRGTSTPYDLPIALAVLKGPLGALTAVAAILLLGGDFVPGLSELDNQRQILAYSLVFGYAQQLVTRLIDDQARNILNALPSKDTAADKPSASVAPAVPRGGDIPNSRESDPLAEG